MNEIDIKHHDVILQANELSRGLYSCSMLGRKIIAFGESRIQEKQIDLTPWWADSFFQYTVIPSAEFKISELMQTLGMTNCGENYLLIKKTLEKLRTAGIEIKNNENEYEAYNWFQSIHYNKQKDKIELTFTDAIGWTLYGLKRDFSPQQLQTIGKINSFYSYRFYEIALSWRGMKGHKGNIKGNWFFQLSPNEIRKMFKIDDNSYKGRMDNFTRNVITKPIEELNEINEEFKIEVSKVVRGRQLVAYRFDCAEAEKEAKKIEISKSDTKQIKDEKRAVNSEQEEMAQLKAKYPQEWQEIFEQEMKNPILFGGEEFKKTTAESYTFQKIKENHAKKQQKIQP